MSGFSCQTEVLERGLFQVYTPRLGAQTVLNVNYLPDLLHHIKHLLTPEQLLRLEDYHLQNYLVELAIGYEGKRSLEGLSDNILSHIRKSNDFWYRHNNQKVIDEEQQLKHHAIEAYQKDMESLRQSFKEDEKNMEAFSLKYKRRTSEGLSMRILRPRNEPHLGTKHCLNHITHIPPFLLNKVSTEHPMDEEQRKQKQKMIRECLLYLISNKRSLEVLASKPRNSSSENEDGEESSSSKSVVVQETDINLMEEFMDYISKTHFIQDFSNSQHMHLLTSNILKVAYKIAASPLPQPVSQKCQYHSPLEMIELPETVKPILGYLSEQPLQDVQCQLMATAFTQLWRDILQQISEELQYKPKQQGKGWLSTFQEIQQVKTRYFEMLSRPDFIQLNNYKAHGANIPWKEQDYLKFLKGLAEFMNIPTNNRKIAAYMGQGIEANHVKHVKGIYLTVMKERIERGECGGGKRGKTLSKIDFLQKDITAFSMKWFEKSKKIKKKKPKKRRRNSQSEDFDDEDSEY